MVDRGASDLMRGITLLGAVESEPIAIVAPMATQIASVEDLITRAGTDPATVPFGTPPPGSPPHLAMLRLQSSAEVTLKIVAFPTAAKAREAAVAGQVAAAALGLSSAIDDLRAGRLLGLGIAADNPASAFPDMPPLLNSGIDLSASIRRGLAAPAGLSQEPAQLIIHAMEAATADPEFHGQADDRGFAATWLDGDSWTVALRDDRARLARLWAKSPWQLGNEG
jgi:tripartite-type tricarboxylate transporter receptor subunit TctC